MNTKKVFQKTLLLLFLLSQIPLSSVTWTSLGANGDWNDNGNWDGTFPNAEDATATFPEPSAGVTVTLGEDITVGTMSITGGSFPDDYNFAAGNSLTFQVSSGNATLTVTSDSANDMNCPIVLNSDLTITETGNAGTTYDGVISGTEDLTINCSTTSTFTTLGAANTFKCTMLVSRTSIFCSLRSLLCKKTIRRKGYFYFYF